MPEKRTYTLDEAVRELALRECAQHGHDLNIITDGTGEPRRAHCGRCGRSWGVTGGTTPS